MTTPIQPNIEQHPDLIELRSRFERVATRPAMQGAEALGVLTGLYLAASPWIAGFNRFNTLAVNDLITGIGFAMLMAGFGAAYERTHAMAWAATLIGVWTVISPWCVAGNVHTTRTIVSQCVAGGVAVLCGLMAAGMAGGTRADAAVGRANRMGTRRNRMSA